MKIELFESIGMKWPISVPETVEEYNILAKRANACLSDAIDHTVYHDTLGDIRYEFTEAVAAALQKQFPNRVDEFKRKEKDTGRTSEDGSPILTKENDGTFLSRILALVGKQATDYPDEKAAVEQKVKFDPSVRERKAGTPKTVPKASLIAAGELIALDGKTVEGNVISLKAIVTSLEGLNPTATKVAYTPEGKIIPESLAWLITANEARKRAATKLSASYLLPATQ
jgi:hypothetical protein